ncbi:hypothetical protein BD779DRAFT_1474687 [Infundibulicybe gibba]|nr:hypothetical protein BD779DRAFT_1474687 [Infundibulicybe gibba]
MIICLFPHNPRVQDRQTIRDGVRNAIRDNLERLRAPEVDIRWVLMGGRHKSPGFGPHWTIRGFLLGRGIHTIHVYEGGVYDFYDGAGKTWRKKRLGIERWGKIF